jgi:hypothetical protein
MGPRSELKKKEQAIGTHELETSEEGTGKDSEAKKVNEEAALTL